MKDVTVAASADGCGGRLPAAAAPAIGCVVSGRLPAAEAGFG